MSASDGVPAFARPAGWNGLTEEETVRNDDEKGMSLRDWFAGQALQCVLVEPWDADEMARRVYGVADAMLAERERKP
jgi:hypothetical protein